MSTSYHRPLRLAFFTPLAPQASGIVDYSEELLPHLAQWADIHLFTDDYTPSNQRLLELFPVWNCRDYPWRREFHGYDCTVYQMGNNRLHRYLYPYVSQFPGVSVLHDFVLHHLLASMTEEPEHAGWYLRDMAYAYGLEGLQAASDALSGSGQPLFFQYPLCQRVLDASLGVLVHSQYLVDQVLALRPDTRVGRITMGVPLPANPGPKPLLRRRLGLPNNAFIIGSFGEITPHKRIPVVLQSLARLLAEGIDAMYVIVGNVALAFDLERQAQELGVWQRVRVTGHLSEEEFRAYVHAVDACVNLRYPTAGETSAAALRCMAAGQPTIVSDVGANQELPDSACYKLPVDEEEVPLLSSLLYRLSTQPSLGPELGQRARQYIESEHSLSQAAKDYISFITDITALIRLPEERPVPIPTQAPTFDQEYLGIVAERMSELGMDARDLLLMPQLGEALVELGLNPHRARTSNEDRP